MTAEDQDGERGYRSPLTPGGLAGCFATVPLLFPLAIFVEYADHVLLPWSHWIVFWIALVTLPAAILLLVRWCVDGLLSRDPD
ncbi:MAG TPA: hypothetical protein VFQ67_12910 [Allosphingosinicella sp.]|nr:hypothetical protein [Allosphingosinicella sp.]